MWFALRVGNGLADVRSKLARCIDARSILRIHESFSPPPSAICHILIHDRHQWLIGTNRSSDAVAFDVSSDILTDSSQSRMESIHRASLIRTQHAR